MHFIQSYTAFIPNLSCFSVQKSGLNKDRITIQGGYKDLDHFGDVVAVNGVNETDKWKSDDCNAIEGSYGSFFPRKLLQDKSKPLYIYNKDICRKLPLVYKEQIPVIKVVFF